LVTRRTGEDGDAGSEPVPIAASLRGEEGGDLIEGADAGPGVGFASLR